MNAQMPIHSAPPDWVEISDIRHTHRINLIMSAFVSAFVAFLGLDVIYSILAFGGTFTRYFVGGVAVVGGVILFPKTFPNFHRLPNALAIVRDRIQFRYDSGTIRVLDLGRRVGAPLVRLDHRWDSGKPSVRSDRYFLTADAPGLLGRLQYKNLPFIPISEAIHQWVELTAIAEGLGLKRTPITLLTVGGRRTIGESTTFLHGGTLPRIQNPLS